jgi:hypothetical protein
MPTPSRTQPDFSLHSYHAIISAFLDDLAVPASCSKESLDNRSFDVFGRWFDYRHHSILIDLCD